MKCPAIPAFTHDQHARIKPDHSQPGTTHGADGRPYAEATATNPQSQRPANTTAGDSFNTGRTLSKAATRLTRVTMAMPKIGVNHIMRKG